MTLLEGVLLCHCAGQIHALCKLQSLWPIPGGGAAVLGPVSIKAADSGLTQLYRAALQGTHPGPFSPSVYSHLLSGRLQLHISSCLLSPLQPQGHLFLPGKCWKAILLCSYI